MRTANAFGVVVYSFMAAATYWGGVPWSQGWIAMLLVVIAMDCLFDAINDA